MKNSKNEKQLNIHSIFDVDELVSESKSELYDETVIHVIKPFLIQKPNYANLVNSDLNKRILTNSKFNLFLDVTPKMVGDWINTKNLYNDEKAPVPSKNQVFVDERGSFINSSATLLDVFSGGVNKRINILSIPVKSKSVMVAPTKKPRVKRGSYGVSNISAMNALVNRLYKLEFGISYKGEKTNGMLVELYQRYGINLVEKAAGFCKIKSQIFNGVINSSQLAVGYYFMATLYGIEATEAFINELCVEECELNDENPIKVLWDKINEEKVIDYKTKRKLGKWKKSTGEVLTYLIQTYRLYSKGEQLTGPMNISDKYVQKVVNAINWEKICEDANNLVK